MFRKLLLLGLLSIVSLALVHAQQRLDRLSGLQFANDSLSWNAVENAGGYQLRW